MTRSNSNPRPARGRTARRAEGAAKPTFNLGNWKVDYVHDWGDSIGFTLQVPGAYFNLILREDRNGGYFISEPARKGSDGKYYRHFTLYLSDADRNAIINAVLDAAGLTDEGGPEDDTPF